jgi:DNA processing protein
VQSLVTTQTQSPVGSGQLHVRGRLQIGSPSVAIVGARAATRRAMTVAYDLGRDLAALGVTVLSGGAIGIDAAAHEGALAAGARTVAILGSGLDAPYPERNRPLFRRILAADGALVSPFADGTPVRRWNFPRRNEVMAQLADAVLVVEASPVSGALQTAGAARRGGRIVAACPGSPGTDALLASGAAMVETADDLMKALAGHARSRSVPHLPESGSDEGMVLSALSATEPRGLEVVAEQSGVSTVRAARALCALELDGLALPARGRYLRARDTESR